MYYGYQILLLIDKKGTYRAQRSWPGNGGSFEVKTSKRLVIGYAICKFYNPGAKKIKYHSIKLINVAGIPTVVRFCDATVRY